MGQTIERAEGTTGSMRPIGFPAPAPSGNLWITTLRPRRSVLARKHTQGANTDTTSPTTSARFR